MTIWDKTCFWTWNSWKSKKLRALLLVQLLKVATGGHFQDSKFKIWLKDSELSLVSFYAAGPFVEKRTSQIDLQKSVKTLQSFINFLLFVVVSFFIGKSTFNIFNSFIWNFKVQLFQLVKNQLFLQGRLQPFEKNEN